FASLHIASLSSTSARSPSCMPLIVLPLIVSLHSPIFFSLLPPPRSSTLFPYTTLFRSHQLRRRLVGPRRGPGGGVAVSSTAGGRVARGLAISSAPSSPRTGTATR